MTEKTQDRAQSLFLNALEQPEAERDAWLQSQCDGDETLLEQLRVLLRHDNLADDPLEKDIQDAIASFPSTNLLPGSDAEPKSDACATPIIDGNQFLSKLTEFGVLSGDEALELSQSLHGGKDAFDPQDFASHLVAEGKLTNYQASALLHGKPDLLIDKYLVLDLIDAGGMGIVLKAIHRPMNRVVALKMISPKLLASPDQVKRFQREVRVAATLEHPNIVRAYDADQSNGAHFLVMEYVRGENLSNLVDRRGPFSVEDALDCIIQTACGLRYSHRRGVTHRDIKPSNLMVTEDGQLKVLDLGLATMDESFRIVQQSSVTMPEHADAGGESEAELTAPGTVLGTVSFMSPEQTLDANLADIRSDIYSLGCTLYYLLAGEAPYKGETVFKVFLQHRDGEIPGIRAVRPDVPEPIEAIIQKMLAKDPIDRYQSIGDLINAIEDCELDLPKREKRSKTRRGHDRDFERERSRSGDSAIVKTTIQPARGRNLLLLSASTIGIIALMIGLYVTSGLTGQTMNDNGGVSSADSVKGIRSSISEESGNTPVEASNADTRVDLDPMSEDTFEPAMVTVSAAELLDSGEWHWRVVRRLAAPINSAERESAGDMTADHLTCVFERYGQLMITTREAVGLPWSKPSIVQSTNTKAWERSPSISSDGLTLVFARKGMDNNRHQTFVVKRSSSEDGFLACEEFAVPDGNARCLDLTPDRRTMTITKNGLLWYTRRTPDSAAWSPLAQYDPPVNSEAVEGAGTLSNDGRMLIFQRGGTGNAGLWMSIRSGWNADWSTPIRILKAEESSDARPRLLDNGTSLLFSSIRDGGSDYDLYLAQLVQKEVSNSEVGDKALAYESNRE